VPIDQLQQRQFKRHGLQTARLRVRDSGMLSHDTTCTVDVVPEEPNTPPTASFTISPTSGMMGTIFDFDASGCSDAEDTLPWLRVSFDWENDGTMDLLSKNASSIQQHRYDRPGLKTVRMQVEDTGGLTDETTRTVYVEAAVSVYLPVMGKR
jgi:PKD repeat protein